MFSSTYTETLATLADAHPAVRAQLQALVSTIITELATAEQHMGALRDAHALAQLEETDPAAKVQLDRLPPFLAGVLEEVATMRRSAIRIAAIARELGERLEETKTTARAEPKPPDEAVPVAAASTVVT